MTPYKLKVITPEKIFFEGETEQIKIRTSEGDIGILANHENYVCNINAGLLSIKIDDKFKNSALSEGILKIIDGEVVVLANTAEWADEIDVERAKRAKEKAEQIIKDSANVKVDISLAEIKLKRALARISVASK